MWHAMWTTVQYSCIILSATEAYTLWLTGINIRFTNSVFSMIVNDKYLTVMIWVNVTCNVKLSTMWSLWLCLMNIELRWQELMWHAMYNTQYNTPVLLCQLQNHTPSLWLSGINIRFTNHAFPATVHD